MSRKTEPSVGRGAPARSEELDYLAWLVDQLDGSGEQTRLTPGSVAVFYDHNSRFRDVLRCELRDDQARRIRRIVSSASALVLAISDTIDSHWLETVCTLLLEQASEKRASKAAPGRSRRVAIVSADALRRSGLAIMELGALETSVNDIVSYLGREPLGDAL